MFLPADDGAVVTAGADVVVVAADGAAGAGGAGATRKVFFIS